jgi:hypothetical protein
VPKLCVNGCELGFSVIGSGGSSVFVDHSTEDLLSTDGALDRHDEVGVMVGRAMLPALAVIIEMSGVLGEDCAGVAGVVDQNPDYGRYSCWRSVPGLRAFVGPYSVAAVAAAPRASRRVLIGQGAGGAGAVFPPQW